MRKKAIIRVLNVRNILIFLLVYMLLFLVSEKGDSIVEIYGGFSVSHLSGLHVFRIMKWALCVLPPIAVSVLFMEEELGTCVIYTVIRTKSIRQWWGIHWLGVLTVNLLYVVSVTAISALQGINRKMCSKDFILFFVIFGIHILSVSVLSVLILFVCKSLKMSVLFFGIVEIALVAAGSISPGLSAYLYPFWGMVKNKNFLLHTFRAHLMITISISAGLVMLCVLYTLRRSNGEGIAAYVKSR
ncbi:MAG: hypothetical protein HFH68_16840 [Lachnospiraceae bacterium]|nr:hypothetical protein [Lachnospiraceae bacterium]